MTPLLNSTKNRVTWTTTHSDGLRVRTLSRICTYIIYMVTSTNNEYYALSYALVQLVVLLYVSRSYTTYTSQTSALRVFAMRRSVNHTCLIVFTPFSLISNQSQRRRLSRVIRSVVKTGMEKQMIAVLFLSKKVELIIPPQGSQPAPAWLPTGSFAS
jgi:hypothetical protein